MQLAVGSVGWRSKAVVEQGVDPARVLAHEYHMIRPQKSSMSELMIPHAVENDRHDDPVGHGPVFGSPVLLTVTVVNVAVQQALPVIRTWARRNRQATVVQKRADYLPSVSHPGEQHARDWPATQQLHRTQRRRNHALTHRRDHQTLSANNCYRTIVAHIIIPRELGAGNDPGSPRRLCRPCSQRRSPRSLVPRHQHLLAATKRSGPLIVPFPIRSAPYLNRSRLLVLPVPLSFLAHHHGQRSRVAAPRHLFYPQPVPGHSKVPMLQSIALINEHAARTRRLSICRLLPPPQLPLPSPHMPHLRRLSLTPSVPPF
mmetsp:Transcript_7573/g.20645  ORF Transcript_7573/g.20645 Transcript_7573/m.20645 type:complete len:315 (-) Transcript_7573:213-1157(-)